jgi:hypothetical protein
VIQYNAATLYLEKKTMKRNAVSVIQAFVLLGLVGYFVALFAWHLYAK